MRTSFRSCLPRTPSVLGRKGKGRTAISDARVVPVSATGVFSWSLRAVLRPPCPGSSRWPGRQGLACLLAAVSCLSMDVTQPCLHTSLWDHCLSRSPLRPQLPGTELHRHGVVHLCPGTKAHDHCVWVKPCIRGFPCVLTAAPWAHAVPALCRWESLGSSQLCPDRDHAARMGQG